MILCNEDCKPCCDFCIHCIHETEEINNKIVVHEPIGCSLYTDKEHQDIAESCSYCEDFHCFRAEVSKKEHQQ